MPLDLLGATDWRRFNRVRRGVRRLAAAALLAGLPGAFLMRPRTVLAMAALWRRLGHFSTVAVRDFVNDRVRERLGDLWANSGRDPAQIPDPVRFRDFDYETYPQLRPLKIIATDILQMRPVLFDRAGTPDVPIGDAVAASIAIPTVFRPVEVRGLPGELGPALFVDGGLVSNLPFWVFNEEKLAVERANPSEPSVPVVGFMLVDAPAGQAAGVAPSAFSEFLERTIRTAILGSQSVANSLLRDVVTVPLVTRLPLLGFDRPWTDIRKDYISGRQCATRWLRNTLQRKPRFLASRLREIVDLARVRLDAVRGQNGRPPVGHLRACLLTPFGGQSLRVIQGHNMEGDADDRLTVDRRGLGAGAAFSNGDAVVMTFAPPGPAFMTKYERALIWPGLRSAICVPVFAGIEAWELPPADRPPALGVLSLDSDDDLSTEYRNLEFFETMVEQSVLLSTAFRME